MTAVPLTDDFGFAPHRRGTHALAGRTVLQLVHALAGEEGGGEAIAVAAALAEVGARPLVAAPAGRMVPELQAVGGVWVEFAAHARNPFAVPVLRLALRRMIKRERVELVHVRSRRAGWIGRGAARAAGVPLVTSLARLSPGEGPVRQRFSAVLLEGDAVLAASKFAADTAAALFPRAADRVALVRPGIDLRPFAASTITAQRVQALRRLFGAAPDERILLLVAKPSAWKGHRVLIEAARLLRERGIDDIKLVFVAGGRAAAGARAAAGTRLAGFAREIEQMTAAAGLAGRVGVHGDCPDLPAALLAAAAVVVPSLEAEAFGRVAVEAQAVGTPVVVSDGGALPETVLAPPEVEPARRTGWRVAPNDAPALAAALEEVLALGASGRDALGRRARQQAEERFSLERMARETLDRYAALLDRDAPSS